VALQGLEVPEEIVVAPKLVELADVGLRAPSPCVLLDEMGGELTCGRQCTFIGASGSERRCKNYRHPQQTRRDDVRRATAHARGNDPVG
jgi:hypothetical protein